MEIDYIGADKVANIIEQSKFTKFIIIRIGASRQQAPIFECLTTSTVTGAKDAFLQWSKITDNSLPYEIILTKDKKVADAGETIATAKELRFFFQLRKEEAKKEAVEGNRNIQDIIEAALLKQAQAYENNSLRKELAELRKEISDRYEEEEVENVNGNGGVNINSLLSGIITNYLTKQLAPTAINGAADPTERLQIAITRLHKIDENIIEDLEKLAYIGEKSPAIFNTLLHSLRSM
jgi:hypothetical protein